MKTDTRGEMSHSKIGGPNTSRPQTRFVRILGDPPPYNLPRRPGDDAPQANGNDDPTGTTPSLLVVDRTREVETTILVVPVPSEPSFWDGFGNAIIALAGVVVVGLLAIGVMLAIASLVEDDDDNNSDEEAAVLALTAENAALKQQFTDYVGDCEDGAVKGEVDRVRVINTHNPGGSEEPALIYAGCIEAANVLGGRITNP